MGRDKSHELSSCVLYPLLGPGKSKWLAWEANPVQVNVVPQRWGKRGAGLHIVVKVIRTDGILDKLPGARGHLAFMRGSRQKKLSSIDLNWSFFAQKPASFSGSFQKRICERLGPRSASRKRAWMPGPQCNGRCNHSPQSRPSLADLELCLAGMQPRIAGEALPSFFCLRLFSASSLVS